MDKNISDIRNEYNKGSISKNELPNSPFLIFEKWLNDAFAADVYEPNAMAISTVGVNDSPSIRMVLLRAFDENGFIFYTNYNSKKGIDISKNNKASILFYWHKLHRQIRIEGTCTKVSETISDNYFKSRPLASQIASAISPQSEKIKNRAFLEEAIVNKEAKVNDKSSIERPKHWGGYCLQPNYFEFWLGRPSRLHDRLCYEKHEDVWKIIRLAP